MRKKITFGLLWSFGERAIAQTASFVVSVILGRLLSPEDYGIIAIVLIFINLADVFVLNGPGESLVRKIDSNDLDFSTLFYYSAFISFILYFSIFITSPFLANIFNNVALISLFRVLGLKLLLSPLISIQTAYISKKMMFKKLFFSTTISSITSGVIGIIMALNGFGVWSLVAQNLAYNIFYTTILLLIVPWKPQFLFSKSSANELMNYSWKITLSSFINSLFLEIKSLIIGKWYSVEDLAFYNKGQQFPSLIISNLDSALEKVIFPTLSKYSNDREQLKTVGKIVLKTSSYIVFPLMIGLIIISKPLIECLLTEKWIPCVPFLRLSCLFFMFQPIQTANWIIIKVTGRSDICLKLEIIKKIIGLLLLTLSIKNGPIAIATSNVIFGFISTIINSLPNNKIIEYSIKEQVSDLFPIFLLNASMAAIMYFLFSQLNINSFLLVIYEIFFGIFYYVIISLATKNDSFIFLISLLHDLFRTKEE